MGRPRWKMPSVFADDLTPRTRSASSLPPLTTLQASSVPLETAAPNKTSVKETVPIRTSTELADLIERSLPLLRDGDFKVKHSISPQMKELLRSFTGEALDEKLVMPLCLLVAAIEEAKKPPVVEEKTSVLPLLNVIFLCLQIPFFLWNLISFFIILNSFFPKLDC